ncbi:homeodomain-like protein [Tanacetum coccineum]
MAYPCLHSPKTTKERSSIRRIQNNSIRRIEDIVCEYSRRYQIWSLLQETPIRRIQFIGYAVNLDNSTNNVLIPLDSWTSGLLEYKLPLSGLRKKSRLCLKNDMPPREKKSLTYLSELVDRRKEEVLRTLTGLRCYTCHNEQSRTRESRKWNEIDYAAQVGCEQCKGPHYTKDCPLKEEGKSLEKAYYTQIGGPFQGRGYRATAPGYYQRNNEISSYKSEEIYGDTLSPNS